MNDVNVNKHVMDHGLFPASSLTIQLDSIWQTLWQLIDVYNGFKFDLDYESCFICSASCQCMLFVYIALEYLFSLDMQTYAAVFQRKRVV